jgi:hypothetical protein
MLISDVFYIAQYVPTQKWVTLVWDDDNNIKLITLADNVLLASRYKDINILKSDLTAAAFDSEVKLCLANFYLYAVSGTFNLKKIDF